MPRLGELIAALEEWFDPSWAESWDAVGLVCGDPDEAVERVLLAIDPVPATVAEAAGAQLLITHHPLLMTAVHGVPANDPKGALVHRMIRAGVAHYVAHTNADVAAPGVSDALADRLGLTDVAPARGAGRRAIGQARRLRPDRGRRTTRGRARGGRRGEARRLREMRLDDRGHRHVPAARRGAARDRRRR